MKRFIAAAATVSALALFATPATADRPGRNWIGSGKVRQILAKRGYHMTKVEADDGHWEGEATRRGRNYEFHVDPHTGAVTKLERDRD